jgi:hypothetical protein
MPRKPLVGSLTLAVALVGLAGCSSGGSDTPEKTPSTHTKSTGSNSPGKGQPTKPDKPTKLQKAGKGGVKNVIKKTDAGLKISLSAPAPGHKIVEQYKASGDKSWSDPATVYEDDSRFCHSIKVKSTGPITAATVQCSISVQDKDGTQTSFVLVSTDGKTWKRLDYKGVSGKPIPSPSGKFVAWSSPASFLLWNPTAGFKTIKYAQDPKSPGIGVMQDDGSLLIIKATSQKHHECVISFQSASARAPVVHTVNSTLPKPDHPRCKAMSAKIQGPRVVANFQQTDQDKNKTTFAYAFAKGPDGHWVVRA